MDKDRTVFSDGRYVLGEKNGLCFLNINGEEYTLTCHPYEPCLYITDKNKNMSAVHNSFDPCSVLERFENGETVTSITGFEYDAADFCRMVEYAARMGDVQIDDAEKVFRGREKKKAPPPANKAKEKEKTESGDTSPRPEYGKIIDTDPAYDVIEEYPDSETEFCLVANAHNEKGLNAHRNALLCASRKLFFDGEEAIWRFDIGKAEGRKTGVDSLFAPVEKNGGLNYRKAFLEPPHTNAYTDADFDRINAALFPNGTDSLEVYEWSTDWSEYFDEGHEWWGALCLTVYDRTLDRFAVIMASATD
ncbi:MAG: hypothetical protein IJV00_09230 [Clostridia bacterium]|nr:hypothetical protein [Clostridia bacterium]